MKLTKQVQLKESPFSLTAFTLNHFRSSDIQGFSETLNPRPNTWSRTQLRLRDASEAMITYTYHIIHLTKFVSVCTMSCCMMLYIYVCVTNFSVQAPISSIQVMTVMIMIQLMDKNLHQNGEQHTLWIRMNQSLRKMTSVYPDMQNNLPKSPGHFRTDGHNSLPTTGTSKAWTLTRRWSASGNTSATVVKSSVACNETPGGTWNGNRLGGA